MWFLNYKQHEPWAYTDSVFTNEECDSIIEIGKSSEASEASIGDYGSANVITSIRKNRVSWILQNEENAWIYQRLTDAVNNINTCFWNFDLSYIEPLQFTQYTEIDDFYTRHVDISGRSFSYRKLSFSLQLSHQEDYSGSELIIHCGQSDNPPCKKDRGLINYFPSYMLHEVTPLQKGIRYALVGWVCGPPFK